MAVQGEAEIISDPEKLPDVVRCSPVSWRCWYMNILQWFYLHSHSRHVFWWNWHEAARVTNGDPFVYMLLLILLEDTVTSQEPPVWMKIFLPLYLPASPPPPTFIVQFCYLSVKLHKASPYMFPSRCCLLPLLLFFQNAFSDLLRLYWFRCHGNHGCVVLGRAL